MTRKLCLSLALVLFAASAIAAQTVDAKWRGRWEGVLHIGDQTQWADNTIAFRMLEKGALVDLPNSRLYGYPAIVISSDPKRVTFAMRLGDQVATFDIERADALAKGVFTSGGAQIGFTIIYSSIQSDPKRSVSLQTKRGKLSGTLELPVGKSGKVPLVILLAGSGPADRDGNACTAPGRHDALKQLAYALAEAGIASYRYDKLGAGESYFLVEEGALRFSHYVEDAVSCVTQFRKDSRFSKVVLLGYTEGALVAAAASQLAKVDGVVACAATSEYPGDVLRQSIEKADEPYRSEGLALLSSLEAGKAVPKVSSYYESSVLRPINQAYVISWLSYKPAQVFAKVSAPMLFVWGELDLQVPLGAFQALCAFKPSAKVAVIPGMNHVLKSVSAVVNDNFNSFSEPDYPLGAGLVEAISGFVSELR
jgi:hypothetical protein